MTAANVKKRMAIVLDGNVDSAPLIQTAIPGGICSIHLGGLKPVNEVLQEAKDLVLTLRGGALPVPLRLVSEERIEPVGNPDEGVHRHAALSQASWSLRCAHRQTRW